MLPNYSEAKDISKATGKDVMFAAGTVKGIVRFHEGNWYWVNINRLK